MPISISSIYIYMNCHLFCLGTVSLYDDLEYISIIALRNSMISISEEECIRNTQKLVSLMKRSSQALTFPIWLVIPACFPELSMEHFSSEYSLSGPSFGKL